MVSAFMYSLTGGTLVTLAMSRPDQISWRFYRVVGFLVFALSCSHTIWCVSAIGIGPGSGGSWTIRMGVVLGIAAAVAALGARSAAWAARLFRAVCALGGVAGLSAVCLSATGAFSQTGMRPVSVICLIVGQALSAFLLGTVTVAWLLGHAYLTATRMTIAPLRRFSRLFTWAVSLRFLFLAICVPFLSDRLSDLWLILVLRAGVGIVAVAVMAFMVSDCVRIRATQSATGILYFASVFTYIGELAHQYLTAQYGWIA